MERYNAVSLIRSARGRRLTELRSVRFHIRSVPHEGVGNIDRARFTVAALQHAGLTNSFTGPDIVLSPQARHSWLWADIHLAGTLPLHDQVFRGR